MSRFVILQHDWPTMHWDFMLEAGAVLRTWRLAAVPEAGLVVAAQSAADHRPCYLDYEGPVSGNRGRVDRWDAGTFTWLADEPSQVVVRLEGNRLSAMVTLVLVTGDTWSCTVQNASTPPSCTAQPPAAPLAAVN